MSAQAAPALQRLPRSSYQFTRLWLGIIGIGCHLAFAWAVLALGIPRILTGLLPDKPILGGLLLVEVLVLGSGLIQLPIDWFAHRTERRFGQTTTSFPVQEYLSALITWVGLFTLAGLGLSWLVVTAPGFWPFWMMVVLALTVCGHLMVLHLPGPRASVPPESWLEAVRRELRAVNLDLPPLAWFDHRELSLGGGWQGVGAWRRLALASSLTELPPRVAAALIAREIGHERRLDRLRSALATFVWGCAGLLLAQVLAEIASGGNELPPATTVAWVVAVLTTWSFVGLFLWPAMGRRQILAADRFVVEAGFEVGDALEMLDTLAERNLPDESLGSVKGYVFHPIPPMGQRRAAIAGD